jgi:hypothetical protein
VTFCGCNFCRFRWIARLGMVGFVEVPELLVWMLSSVNFGGSSDWDGSFGEVPVLLLWIVGSVNFGGP